MSDDIAALATAAVEEAVADEGGATEDVCEALSEEINRREVAEGTADWCVTCNYSGIRTPATATHVGDVAVHLCVACAKVYDDIRTETS